MRSKALGSRLAKGLALAVAVGGLVDAAFAATYELTVDEGTTDLAAALATQYPGAALAENDTIVK